MENDLYSSVIKVFVDLYEEGLIYKGVRMVNWDPVGLTALSDEEVIHKEVDSNLYYVRYQIEGENEFVTIATTRPETILGDTAVCVNPTDERYSHLKGKNVIVPIVNRSVPIIFDEYVTPEFGTGALKITPAHDINDYNLGLKHNVKAIDTLNDDGTLSEAAGFYVGKDRFWVRKQIAKDLDEIKALVKVESIKNKVGTSERTGAVIEPKISQQWFVNMEKFIEKNPEVISSVADDEVAFFPPKFKNTYRHWMENLKDWCISRQLWWGQQIPAYYLPTGETVVAESAEDALKKAQAINPSLTMSDLTQDEDVLDTWFSSWLWPISVFNGINDPENDELKYYYPTNTLVTGPDIIFFWVARMIMAGYHYKDQKPFDAVYFTGIVRDKKGRKMSKQLGNSPDPIELMNQFGTDGVRMGLLMAAPAGNDLLFDESLCEQGRNFSNKLWNASKLIDMWEADDSNVSDFYNHSAEQIHQWMEAKISESVKLVDDHFSKFRVSDAMLTLYKLAWGDFCSWYLEWIKPPYGEKLPQTDIDRVRKNYDQILRLIHPFMPFVTEHLWQNLNQESNDFINNQSWPGTIESAYNFTPIETTMELITLIRSVRNKKGISPKIAASINVTSKDEVDFKTWENAISKLANVDHFNYNSSNFEGTTELLGTFEVTVQFEGVEAETKDVKAIQTEIKRLQGFLFGIEKKLSNKGFVQNAKPEVIEREKQKQSDTIEKIASLNKELE
jgi:valyl-tRNA synthetase